MTMRLRRALTMTLVALGLAGCAGDPSSVDGGSGKSASGPVVGPRWNLLLVGTSDRISMSTKPYFQVTPDGQVSGNDGCNTFTGKARFSDGNRITFDKLESTRTACPRQQDAGRVTAMLDTAYRYLIDHDRLVFFGPDQRVLGGFQRSK